VTGTAPRLAGRVGVVTGAGRGLGREIARELAAEGMALLALSRTGSEVRTLADEVAEAYGTPVLAMGVDVTDVAAVERAVLHAEQHLGPVDLLVNNAGRIESAELPFWQADLDELWGVVETNLRAPMVMTRTLLPAMVQRGRGHVVNVTSRARAATRTGTYTGYAVSKRAVTLLTEALAQALAGTGVVVVDLLPGLVRTPMTAAMPAWRDVPPEGWDPASASARLVVEVALGRHDAAAGTVLDAPALAAGDAG
jgi:3-oxoacyl-[acyl-carrier protein] reductase